MPFVTSPSGARREISLVVAPCGNLVAAPADGEHHVNAKTGKCSHEATGK